MLFPDLQQLGDIFRPDPVVSFEPHTLEFTGDYFCHIVCQRLAYGVFHPDLPDVHAFLSNNLILFTFCAFPTLSCSVS
jgi:hypothetical protein